MFTRRDGGGQPIDVRGQVHDDPIDRDLRERLEERLVRDLAGRRATLLPTDLAQLLEHPPQALLAMRCTRLNHGVEVLPATPLDAGKRGLEALDRLEAPWKVDAIGSG